MEHQWTIYAPFNIYGFSFLSSHKEEELLPKRYVNVKVPEELAKEIDELVKRGILGYRSRGEFIAEAIRERLLKVKTNKNMEKWKLKNTSYHMTY